MRQLVHRFVSVTAVAVVVAAWLAGALALGAAAGSGAPAAAAPMTPGGRGGGGLLLLRHGLALADRIARLGTESQRSLGALRRIESRLGTELKQTFRQVEALQNLSAMLPTSDVLPATRGWAASPDLLLVL